MKKNKNSLLYIILTVLLIPTVFPFFWMVSSSFMSYYEITSTPPRFFPEKLLFGNYTDIFKRINFGRLFFNSVITTGVTILGQLLFCSMAGYTFARREFPFKNFLFIFLMSILMVPGNMFILPQFLIMVDLKLINSLTGLFLPGVFGIFGTFLLRQFFSNISRSIEEAAILDGCNHFQIYWKVMLPMIRPGLAVLSILAGLWAWNNMLWPLILNSAPEKMTLSAGLATLSGQQHDINFPQIMAASGLAVLPMIILFFIFNKFFIQSISIQGDK